MILSSRERKDGDRSNRTSFVSPSKSPEKSAFLPATSPAILASMLDWVTSRDVFLVEGLR